MDEAATKDTEVNGAPAKKGFDKWVETAFLAGVAGASIIFGFSSTLASAKKKDPEFFDKGMTPSGPRVESGGALAVRALKWGTFYAVAGCSILFYGIWKLMGVKNLQEFRMKSGGMLPEIPKNNPPQGRTEFENLTDLLQYIIDEDNRLKAEKSASQNIDNSSEEVVNNVSQ